MSPAAYVPGGEMMNSNAMGGSKQVFTQSHACTMSLDCDRGYNVLTLAMFIII